MNFFINFSNFLPVYGHGDDETVPAAHESDYEPDADVDGEYSQSAASDFSQSTSSQMYKHEQQEYDEGSDEEYYNNL